MTPVIHTTVSGTQVWHARSLEHGDEALIVLSPTQCPARRAEDCHRLIAGKKCPVHSRRGPR